MHIAFSSLGIPVSAQNMLSEAIRYLFGPSRCISDLQNATAVSVNMFQNSLHLIILLFTAVKPFQLKKKITYLEKKRIQIIC